MAKRKRLSAAQPEYLSHASRSETKSNPFTAPPIAQVAGEAATVSALRELTDMVTEARTKGLLLQELPLEAVDAGHLVRDRVAVDPVEQAALVESLRARGQQTPIDVMDHGEDTHPRYGLISGWRRLSALRQICDEDGGDGTVLAQIRVPEGSSEAYVAMVEENEIRAGLSFYERARIVVKALEEGVYPDAKTALQTLYANVSRAKRSKIKSFMVLVESLENHLRFPTRIGERLGLQLASALQHDSAIASRLKKTLQDAAATSPETEHAVLIAALRAPAPSVEKPAQKSAACVPDMLFDVATSTITLSGPGVDADLARELTRWLARR